MSPSPKPGPPPGSRSDRRIEALYTSATTRVARVRGDGGGVSIWKEFLGPGRDERLRRERQMLERFASIDGIAEVSREACPPNVIALRDGGGRALSQVLSEGRLGIASVLSIGVQLSRTLAEVHRAGVIHRDINPANIIISPSGETSLIDFDLAVSCDAGTALPRGEGMTGTLAYLAPEQTGRTGRGVDQRADLYSLGATLYEMAAGRPPFEARDTLQLIHDHLVREPAAPALVDASVPRGLSAIILRLLAKDPGHRYQSAEGLLHDLRWLSVDLEAGGDGEFELGLRDFPARFAAPAQLVGRDAEIAALRSAFADAMQTPRHTVLIEGASGAGKSALLHELAPVASAAKGWFLHAKFDQYRKDGSTSGGLSQTLRTLARLLLAQPGEQVAQDCANILRAFGRNAGLVTQLAPEFELLLGPQPEVPELDPRQAEARLQRACMDLLGAIASPARPLVVVVDDLHWAGTGSLRAVETLIMESSLRGLLLVAAYRAGEAGENDALPAALARWSAHPQAPLLIQLTNLGGDGMRELIMRMLRLDEPAAGRLSAAVGALAGGNPFDTVELLDALRRDGVLRMDEAGWKWDEDAIRHFVGGGNVVDLLAARIARLPAASCELLQFLACLGSHAPGKLLCAASALDSEQLHSHMQAPLQDGLVLVDSSGGEETWRFRHDRVQQAVLQAMDDAQRAERHLQMARRLGQLPEFEVEAAVQYLACSGQLQERAEQQRAARLCHAWARQLASRASYGLAERCLMTAAKLLDAVNDPADAELRADIDVRRHAALYSIGRLGDADAAYAALRERIADPLALVQPTCLQMRALDNRGRIDLSMSLGLGLLRELGLQVPSELTDADTRRRLDALDGWVRQDRLVDHSKRAVLRDPRLLAIAALLGRTARSTLARWDTKLFVWLLLEIQRLWAGHGPCPEAVSSLGRIAAMVIEFRGDHRSAFEVAEHVVRVGEALGYEPHTSEARFLLCAYAAHWVQPLETVLREVTRGYLGVHAGGDLAFACNGHIMLMTYVLETAPTLDESEAEVASGMALCERTGNMMASVHHQCQQQLVRALMGRTQGNTFNDAQFDEDKFLATTGKLFYAVHSYLECRALFGVVMGDASVLVPSAVRGMGLIANLTGYYITVFAHFLAAMARAWQLRETGLAEAEREQALAQLDACRNWLAARAADQPHNFLHLLRLVEAETAWSQGDHSQATRAFNSALEESQQRARPWHRALITERAGLFQLQFGLAHAGRQLLADARGQYEAWGAAAKVAKMDREHAFLRDAGDDAVPRAVAANGSLRGSASVSADALDFMGVLRASQAMSSETSLERLTARVKDVLESLSGATKVQVLLWSDDAWWLLAPSPEQPAMPLAEAGVRGLVPVSVFAYVERTGDVLVVDDACADTRFSRDPYFAGVPECSLLAAPISSQGSLRAMLLLENRQGRAAFNAQRLDAVMLIAGQLAVSLANAQLYGNLEQRVQARTRELEETHAQLVATARRAGKAEIANNVLHNVGNVLNSVNVSARVVRQTIANSRIESLARAVELMNEHKHHLWEFIRDDPRGQALLGYFNQLVPALQEEREHALGDIERLTSSVDHITYVVARQQSHSGPSSVLEFLKVGDLLEEALRLSRAELERCRISVVGDYGGLPEIALDGQRLTQILVNLMANAAQAMESLPQESRRLTLSTSLVRDEKGQRLRIGVRDEGEGISPENLTRVFSHGFTTRAAGHGFGLHSSALAAMEMGGKLTVHSEGAGKGALFVLELPIEPGRH